jgi:hypothetical protein
VARSQNIDLLRKNLNLLKDELNNQTSKSQGRSKSSKNLNKSNIDVGLTENLIDIFAKPKVSADNEALNQSYHT